MLCPFNRDIISDQMLNKEHEVWQYDTDMVIFVMHACPHFKHSYYALKLNQVEKTNEHKESNKKTTGRDGCGVES